MKQPYQPVTTFPAGVTITMWLLAWVVLMAVGMFIFYALIVVAILVAVVFTGLTLYWIWGRVRALR